MPKWHVKGNASVKYDAPITPPVGGSLPNGMFSGGLTSLPSLGADGYFTHNRSPVLDKILAEIASGNTPGSITTKDRREYQTRYRETLTEQDNRIVESLIKAGGQFTEDDFKDYTPGSIQAAVDKVGRGKLDDPDFATSKVLRQATSNQRQKAQIEALGGDYDDGKGPSLLTRALDLASRVGYGMAEGASRGYETMVQNEGDITKIGEVLGDTARGIGSGLSGEDKTTFHDYLKTAGMKEGKPTAALGFAMDVGLDPTTYMTFGTAGVAKGAGRELAESVAEKTGRSLTGKATRSTLDDVMEMAPEAVFKAAKEHGELSEAILHPTTRAGKVARSSIRDQAVADAKAFALQSGDVLDTSALTKIGNQAVRDASDAAAKRVTDLATEAKRASESLAKNKEVQVKIMGQRVAGSTKAYKPIRVVADSMRGSKVGNWAHNALRTDAGTGKAIHALDRQFKNVEGAQFENELRQIQKSFSGTTKKQRSAVTEAIESGDISAIKGSPKLMRMHDEAKEWFQQIAQRDVEIGALKPEEVLDNYVYHVYRKKRPNRALGTAIPNRGGKYKTLKEAEAAGAKPVTDIADILQWRLAKAHKVDAQYSLHQQIAELFGMDLGSRTAKGAAFKRIAEKEGTNNLVSGKKVSRFMPDNVYFDAEVGDSLKKLDQFFTSEESTEAFKRVFDTVQGKFKFIVTAPNPGFHVRNLMGDMFVNFLDGVIDPRVYSRAERVLRGSMDPSSRLYKKTGGHINVAGHQIPLDEMMMRYEGQGLKSGFFHGEEGLISSPGRKVVAQASSAIRSASEFREDLTRMAHFIDAFQKEGANIVRSGKKLDVNLAAERAAARVRKYNFDYQDLTKMERTVLKRAIPFYTYMRKNIPLQLESLFTRPGRVAVVPKGLNAMQKMIGAEQNEDPFPGIDEVLPDWMREMPGVRMATQTGTQSSVFLQPDLPINQLQDMFGGFVNDQGRLDPTGGGKRLIREIAGAASPLATMPVEFGTGRDIATGAPVRGDLKEQLLSMIPAVATGKTAFQGDFKQDQQQYGGMSERLINYLTGAGIRVNTPQRQLGQLRKDEDIIQVILDKLRNDLAAKAGVPEERR